MRRGFTSRIRRFLRPPKHPEFGSTAEMTKVIEAGWTRLMAADDGKAAEVLAEVLEEVRGELAADEGESAADERAYRDHIEHIAKAHPDPDVRSRAAAVVERLKEQSKTEVLKAARERREDETVRYLRGLAARSDDPTVRLRAREVLEQNGMRLSRAG